MLRARNESPSDSGPSFWNRHRARARSGSTRLRLRHAFEEASLHLGAALAELSDWIRIGR